MDETGSLPHIGYYIGIVFCACFSFLYSGLEAGLLSLNRIWLREKVDQGNRNALLLQNILNNPSKLISVMLTMETTSNVVLAVLWTRVGHKIFISILGYPGWFLILWGAILLILIVMFIEVLPKVLFASNAKRITIPIAPAAHWLIQIVYPFASVLAILSRMVIWIFTRKWFRPINPKVTQEDLMTLVSIGGDKGVIEEQEMEMIHSIFMFGNLVAREIMVPRIDMVALDIDQDINDAVEMIIEKGHSRIPVFKDSRDHIKGILYAKDLLRHIEADDLDSISLDQIIRTDILFVPGMIKLENLLEQMRAKKAHIAVVTDEYGGTAGIVTIEDVLEEIVGDIQDEYDKPLERLVADNGDGSWTVDSKLGLHDFDDEFGISLPERDGIETIGGLLYLILERIPKIGDVIFITPVYDDTENDYIADRPRVERIRIEVLEIADNRIGKLKVTFEQETQPDTSVQQTNDDDNKGVNNI